MIKVIIFGLWETLGTKHFSASKRLQAFFKINETPNFLLHYEESMQLEKWDTMERMAQSFLKKFNIPITERNISSVIETIQQGIDEATLFDGMKEILEKLSKLYKLTILSNTNTFESRVVHKWGIESYFDDQLYSWALRSLKPSQINFDTMCKKFDVLPQNCLLVDNEKRTIEAARKYGMKIIAFQNVPSLEMELNRLNI